MNNSLKCLNGGLTDNLSQRVDINLYSSAIALLPHSAPISKSSLKTRNPIFNEGEFNDALKPRISIGDYQ